MSDLTLSSLVQLPDEILEKILLFLPTRDLQRVSCTCRRINNLAKADRIWQPLTVAAFGEAVANSAHQQYVIRTWRQTYQLEAGKWRLAEDFYLMRMGAKESKVPLFLLRSIEITGIAPAFAAGNMLGSMGGRTVTKLICPSQYLSMLPGFLEKAVIGVISANQYIAQQKKSPSQIEKRRTFGFRHSEKIKEIFATVMGVECFLEPRRKALRGQRNEEIDLFKDSTFVSEIRYTHCQRFEHKGATSLRSVFCSRVWVHQTSDSQVRGDIPDSNFSLYPRVELSTSSSEATLYD